MFRYLSVIIALSFLFGPTLSYGNPFEIKLERKHTRPRGVFWPQLGSFAVPGLNQWIEKQYLSAGIYSGVAAAGLGVTLSAALEIAEEQEENGNTEAADLNDVNDWDDKTKRLVLGSQVYQLMGSLSAYHSFRTSVLVNNKFNDDFKFLKRKDEVSDLMLAPLKFKFLARPTTFVPLGLLAIGSYFYLKNRNLESTNGGDILFYSTISNNAGVGEEALFRGWLMPVMRKGFGSDFWSNTTTSALFSAAHISPSNPIPWPQFLMGFYLGWMTQRNDWSLQESVFVHTWWDVLAFTTYFIEGTKKEKAVVLPLFSASFQ